jgi:hypothetical protein
MTDAAEHMEVVVFDSVLSMVANIHILMLGSVSGCGEIPTFVSANIEVDRALHMWCYEGGLQKHAIWDALSVVLSEPGGALHAN